MTARKSRILVVDDMRSIRFYFDYILSSNGYLVTTAADYHSALQIMDSQPLDLIYADIILDDHSGLDILVEAKRRALLCPVILITGSPKLETASEAVRQGAYDYLPKPIHKNTLLRVTQQALNHKMSIEESIYLQTECEKYRRNLDSIFRSVKDAIITVDKDRKVITANEATNSICGVSSTQITGCYFPGSLSDCSQNCKGAIEEVLKSGKSVDEYLVRCKQKQENDRVVLLNCSPWKDEQGNFVGAVLVIRDVTRLNELETKLLNRNGFQKMIGQSRPMQHIFQMLEQLKDVDTNVLITGESGTGKSMAARALHDSGPRAKKPFVTVNCSTLSETLLESELFGHIKGAYTGAAQDKVGRFELADGGSIFLDEIGDISPKVQLKLLAFLQDHAFERVGDSKPIKVDVRIIAATNQDLEAKVQSREFRQDLYYRLKVVKLNMPPLRERPEDIPLLVEHFRTYFNQKFKKDVQSITSQVIYYFQHYPWPGNVRELMHAMEHAFVLCKGKTIYLECLPPELIKYSETESAIPENQNLNSDYQRIFETLEKTGWNKAKAARMLGISRQTLYKKIKNLGLSSSG